MRLGGQASVETIAIMGISLLILLAFFMLSSDLLSDLNVMQNQDDARRTVQSLARAADAVNSQGEGASQVVLVVLPPGTNFSASRTFIGSPEGSSLPNSTININVGGTDFFAISQSRLQGTFPRSSGTYEYRVVSRGGHVGIYPHLMDIGTQAVFISMGRNDARNASVRIHSSTNETLYINSSMAWPHGAYVSANLSPLSQEAGFEGGEVRLSFNSSASSGGHYSSLLSISATANQSGAQENQSVPVTIFVE